MVSTFFVDLNMKLLGLLFTIIWVPIAAIAALGGGILMIMLNIFFRFSDFIYEVISGENPWDGYR